MAVTSLTLCAVTGLSKQSPTCREKTLIFPLWVIWPLDAERVGLLVLAPMIARTITMIQRPDRTRLAMAMPRRAVAGSAVARGAVAGSSVGGARGTVTRRARSAVRGVWCRESRVGV